MNRQRGFAALEIILVVVVVAIAGFAAYRVYDTKNQDQAPVSTSVDVPTAPAKITNASELAEAEKALDATNPDDASTDASQLDSELSTF